MRQQYPLITHESLDDIIAYCEGRPVSVRRFLADVSRVGKALLGGAYIINLCNDRYRFMVGLAASVMAGKISLLPSSRTAGVFRNLANFAPAIFCLTDGCAVEVDLPCVAYPEEIGVESEGRGDAVPLIDGGQTIAYVFTSGSTEVPVPHPKTWGSLVMNVRAEAELLGMEKGRRYTLIGSVPPQHMYGFESTVLLAMQSGSAMVSGRQFYPLDICAAIASAPRPRILVSTPFHLHSLMADGLDVPPVDLVVSATAPISAHLVSEVEVRFDAPLLEIYGCTETGQIACRQPSVGAEWRLFPGVRLTSQEGQLWASGGHVEGIVPLPDQLELTGEDRFIFQGRNADMINIAGNRSSLAYLNHQLNTLPGVQDGAFFMPDDLGSAKVTRLVAFVVAPGLDESALIRSLREQIHPAFLPRPLLLVDALPRNATGKLPREALRALAQALANRSMRDGQH